ncbi:transcription initiation factor TFIID subunit 4 isoform X2 [Amyelois transitella]|uniref:transcription initiation factor TFIID subunit 4 isoform X2 n=1 Tax=Amyelois transitella TaxID=680683 RepID=UPI002990373C|nr:transcription initiation factor TFIID subunit 4 isoform X2 [Amyelois transitella]
MLPMVQPEPVIFNCGGHSANGAAAPSNTLPPSLTPESDVDELVDIFFDVDVAVNTYPRIESCDLQLGDTWRGMQGKMSVTTPVKKIRKKSDNKPQSQINKCHNEKRRRELENETINQLEELLGTCLAEVKQPDKNGIVRAATLQIKEVLERRGECPGECPVRNAQCLSPVQAGEVSSTQPPACLHYTEITTLIEALKHYTGSLGWVLLEINSKGEIECVSENIKDLTLQDRTELYKKSIFSLLHVNDQAKLKPLLRVIESFAWGSGEIEKFQAIQARLLVKNTDGTEGTGYVEAVIHAAPVRGSSSEEAGSVMCVIRRREDASAALLPLDGGPPAIAAKQSDHIVFRLDCNYIILSCDLRGVENIINCPVSLVGTRYLELVDSSDRVLVVAHLQQTASFAAPPAVSAAFRLRLAPDLPPLRVSARSRLFRAQPASGEPDFIMSTHTLLADDDLELLDEPRPAPLSASVSNGESSDCDRYRSPISPGGDHFLNDFDLDPWGSGFQLGDMSGEDAKDRKDASSEPPATPATPRAPPTPGSGPPSVPPAEEPNRLRTLLSKKPAPGDVTLNSNNRILKDLLKEDEEATGSETSAPHTPLTPHTPAAAMSPLHSRPSPHPAHTPHAPPPPHAPHSMPSHNSEVLLRILNDKSDEDGEDRRNSDGRNTSQPCALLSQLLSSSNGPSGNGRSQDSSDNYLERIAGVKRKLEEKGAAANAKRATPENQQVSSSAVPPASSVPCSAASSPATTSSGGMSQLCQKNQILVSLLARQQTTPTTPLPLPNPNLRAYGPATRPRPPLAPQQMSQQQQRHHHSTLSTILTGPAHRASSVNGGPGPAGSPECGPLPQSHLQMVLQGARGAYPPPAAPPAAPLHYANTAPAHHYAGQPGSSSRSSGQAGAGDSEVPSDQTLSDILDEVIDHMPDADRPAPSVSTLIDLETSRQLSYAGKEKNAMINAITQSLMQCETVTKSPVSSSPGAPPVYAVQSPSSCNMGSMGGLQYARGADGARARQLEEQHARLLQLQRRQQMLVSPEAAEQPQADLGSTINALVSETPPNVALTRTDYHHLYHQSNQMGSNYGTNKITSSQQNPMLSRQLSGSGAGYAPHSAAALHTPLSAPPPPQPYLRAPRPHLVGGYYEDGASAGYCGDFARRPPLHHHAPMPHAHHEPPLPCASNNGGAAGGGAVASGTSEYVRNELRAVVGARLHPPLQSDLDPLMTFDISTSGGGSGGPAPAGSWEPQTTPNTTEAVTAEAGSAAAAGGDETAAEAKASASLLQKLLSQ